METSNIKQKRKYYFFVLLIMVFVTVVFLNSFYWPYEEISKRKILVGTIAFLCVVIVPLLSVKIDKFFEFVARTLQYIKNCIERVKKNKRRILLFGFLTLFAICLSCVVTYIISKFIFEKGFNIRMFYTLFALEGVVLVIIFLRKSAVQKPENIFVIVALIMGIYCISVTPSRVGVSADDEIHLSRTLELANFLNGIMFEADEKNINEYLSNVLEKTGYDRETDYAYKEELNYIYATRKWNAHQFTDYGIWSVSYIPAAVGIVFARGLGLSYTGVFNMGRLFNLLMYVILVYFAIRRIKYGKVLITAIGLIPATIFLASSYSYDPWVIGFTILGFSYFFAELQEEETLSNRNILIMIGSIMVGSLPKAVYFALLFPMLFMPKKKFKSTSQRKFYYMAIIASGLVLVLSFLLPMFINGAGTGDLRGGADVNSTEQIKFILANPFAYAKNLLNFELEYFITLGNAGLTLQTFGYMGGSYFYGVVSLMLVVLAILDRGEHEKRKVVVRGATLLGTTAVLVLATTALYISFTAVGAEGVAGMQGRYLLPFIYPSLYALGIDEVTHKVNKVIFVCVPILICAITFICNIGRFCAIYY